MRRDAGWRQSAHVDKIMGRINFARYMIDRKGITDHVALDGMPLASSVSGPGVADTKATRVEILTYIERIRPMLFLG
jgi:hypothetical protein